MVRIITGQQFSIKNPFVAIIPSFLDLSKVGSMVKQHDKENKEDKTENKIIIDDYKDSRVVLQFRTAIMDGFFPPNQVVTTTYHEYVACSTTLYTFTEKASEYTAILVLETDSNEAKIKMDRLPWSCILQPGMLIWIRNEDETKWKIFPSSSKRTIWMEYNSFLPSLPLSSSSTSSSSISS